MNRIELGKTGEKHSQYVLGTMLMGSALDTKDSFEIMDDFVQKRGGDFLDTANCYAWWLGTGEYCGDESETVLGKWMNERKNRKDVFLATKGSARLRDHMAIRNPDGIPRWDEIPSHYEGASEKVIRSGLEDSLRRLQTEYIDLYYIHVDDRKTNLEETLATTDALVKEGKIRYLGYSNIQTWRLEQVFRICEKSGWTKPVAVQLEYSYVNPAKYGKHEVGIHAKEDFFDWMQDRGDTSLVAYSPLLKGIYCDQEKRKAVLTNPEFDTAETRKRLERIDKISSRLNVHPGALVLAWMAKRKEGIFPILGFSKQKQYLENIGCLDIILDDETMAELAR